VCGVWDRSWWIYVAKYMMSEHWIFLAYVYEAYVETWCSTAVNERSMMCCYLNANLHLVFSKKKEPRPARFLHKYVVDRI
jgi:hypothetical protein